VKPPGIVLAGGLARRLGSDKPLQPLAGRPLLSHVSHRFRPQVADLALNANGDARRFAQWPLAVVPDPIADHPGPLAGVLAGMQWAARAHPQATWIATAPVDSPFLPADLVARLMANAPEHDIVLAVRNGQIQPVCGVWSLALRNDLLEGLRAGARKVETWARGFRLTTVSFDEDAAIDPFFNINTPDDLVEAERWLRALSP